LRITSKKGYNLGTQKKIVNLKAKIAKLYDQIKEVQAECPHDWEVVDSYNDHDGWSRVTITYYERRKCRVCEKTETVETGTSLY
jgi:hypothetical protein